MNKILFLLLLALSHLACAQERFVDLDGQKFRIKEFGEGDVTVIFENGMSDSIEVWGTIPNAVAKFAHVFLYDRADIGKSDTSTRERAIPNMCYDLENVLEKEKKKCNSSGKL